MGEALKANILPTLSVKSTKSIQKSEAYLASKHNQLNIFTAIDDLVTDEEKLPESERTAIEHHILNLRAAIARALWSQEIYVGRSILDECVLGAGKAGGAVHFIAAEQVPDNRGRVPDTDLAASALMADASCASCDLWLHANWFPEGMTVGLHYHSEDEIILVTRGEIILGNRRLGAGTAVSVAKNAVYTFTAGAGGMDMVNFRAGSPVAIQAKTKHQIDEAGFFLSRCGHPEHSYVS